MSLLPNFEDLPHRELRNAQGALDRIFNARAGLDLRLYKISMRGSTDFKAFAWTGDDFEKFDESMPQFSNTNVYFSLNLNARNRGLILTEEKMILIDFNGATGTGTDKEPYRVQEVYDF